MLPVNRFVARRPGPFVAMQSGRTFAYIGAVALDILGRRASPAGTNRLAARPFELLQRVGVLHRRWILIVRQSFRQICQQARRKFLFKRGIGRKRSKRILHEWRKWRVIRPVRETVPVFPAYLFEPFDLVHRLSQAIEAGAVSIGSIGQVC